MRRTLIRNAALVMTMEPRLGDGELGLIPGGNVLPCPTVLCTQIRPPMSSTSRFEILRPSPVPPYWRVVEVSTCKNHSKIALCFSVGIPIPVSRTEKCSTASGFSGSVVTGSPPTVS